MDESQESQFQEGDKPHHIQISDAFQTYLLIPGLLLLAVLGKVLENVTGFGKTFIVHKSDFSPLGTVHRSKIYRNNREMVTQ